MTSALTNSKQSTDHLLFIFWLQAETSHIQHGHTYQYWPESGWIPQAVLRSTLHLDNLGDCSSPQLMTAEQVKAMSISDHQDHWRMLVFRLAILIPKTQGRLDSAAGLRLQVGTLHLHLIVEGPCTACQL